MTFLITFFCGRFALYMEIKLKLRFFFVRHCDVLFITSQLHYLFVWCNYVFKTLELRYIWVRTIYLWKWHGNYVSFLFVIVTYFLLSYNYVIYLFDVVTFFDDVRNFLFWYFRITYGNNIIIKFRFCSSL